MDSAHFIDDMVFCHGHQQQQQQQQQPAAISSQGLTTRAREYFSSSLK